MSVLALEWRRTHTETFWQTAIDRFVNALKYVKIGWIPIPISQLILDERHDSGHTSLMKRIHSTTVTTGGDRIPWVVYFPSAVGKRSCEEFRCHHSSTNNLLTLYYLQFVVLNRLLHLHESIPKIIGKVGPSMNKQITAVIRFLSISRPS